MLVRKRARNQRAVGPSLFDASCGGRGAAGDAASEASGPAAPGLSLVHSDTLTDQPEVGEYVVSLPRGGAVVRVSRVAGRRGRDDEDEESVRAFRKLFKSKKRGTIKGLSPAAALRLKRAMLSVDGSRVVASFFVANTVPAGEFGWDDCRVFLRRYRTRFERRWSGVVAFWVKELTNTGTPHLHFVILWLSAPPSLTEFRAWNDDAWASVVRSSHPRHREVGCRVDLVRSYAGSAAYLSSYLKKKVVKDEAGNEVEQRQSDTGRMWGIIGKSHLPVTWDREVVSAEQGKTITRTLRRLRVKKGRYYLRSESSHDSLRTQGKPCTWHRVRPHKVKAINGVRLVTLDEQLHAYRSFGLRVKRVTPRVGRNIWVNVWSSDSDTGRVEKTGEELHFVSSSWHFVKTDEVAPLLSWVKGDRAAPLLTACEKRWLKNGDIGAVQSVRKERADDEGLGGRSAARGAEIFSESDMRPVYELVWGHPPPAEQPHPSG